MKTQEQYKILKKHFGGKFVDTGLEGYVIPKVKGDYTKNIQKALDAIKSTRPFYNWREGQIDDKHLRRLVKTITALSTVYKAQKGDYIVIPAQLGTKYKGKSVDQARKEFEANEFGLGTFEVACILLTHPDTIESYIKSYKDLYLDCAGDEASPVTDGVFSSAPSFYWVDGGLRFIFRWARKASGSFGAASAWISK